MNEAYVFFTVIYSVVALAILVLSARDAIKKHNSRRTQRAADFACTCAQYDDFTAQTDEACPVHGRASQSC